MPRRLNATRHGLAGAAPVLPWENAEQRARLLEQLRGEHAPAGATESHLVEELADILWRRRRLRRAEHAAHHDRLRRMTSDGASHVSSGESAWLATPLLLVSDTSRVAPGAVRDVLRLDQAARRDALGALDARLEAARAAGRYAEGARATEGGIERRLDRASREAWYRAAAETPCDPGAEPSLFAWLHETLLPALDARRAVLVYADLIRDHLFASALDEVALERLQRHDATLDRRFERTLSMLVKLKALREA